MYEVKLSDSNGVCEWDTELYHFLMMDKRITSSREAAEIRKKLMEQGALPYLEHLYDWATLCIAYCFAKERETRLEEPKDKGTGNEIPSFRTCFQENALLWLAYISDALFEYTQGKKCTQEDLYRYIQLLWHTGAVLLWEEWEKCRRFKPDSHLEAKQVFLGELAKLAKKHSDGRRANVSDQGVSVQNEQAVQMVDAEKLIKVFQAMKWPVKRLDFHKKGVRFDVYRLALNAYINLNSPKYFDELCSQLGVDNHVLRLKRCTTGEANSYDLHVLRPQPQWQQLDDAAFRKALSKYTGYGVLPVCLGADEYGQAVFRDLTVAPHVMIGGASGSGKSVLLRMLLESLLVLNAEQGKLEVAVIDNKAVDFQRFVERLFQKRIFSEKEEILDLLNDCRALLEQRKQLMVQYGVTKISELPHDVRPSYRVVIVDELADLLAHDESGEIEAGLVHLTATARAAGIHIILCTQRPDHETVKGQLRSNTSAKIALQVNRSSESKIILDETGAEHLFCKGDHLVIWPEQKETCFLHGFNI